MSIGAAATPDDAVPFAVVTTGVGAVICFASTCAPPSRAALVDATDDIRAVGAAVLATAVGLLIMLVTCVVTAGAATAAIATAIATGDGEGPIFATMPLPLISPTAMVELASA